VREAGSEKKGGSKCNRHFDHKVGWRRREAGRREEGREEADGQQIGREESPTTYSAV
jgi:hypothetical protein